MNNHDLSDKLKAAIQFLVDKYEKEDNWFRKYQVRQWKKHENFWHGLQFIYWSESRQDWLSPASSQWFGDEEGREGVEGPFYDFVVNIYRSHGEAIIAALGASVPTVRFPPDNADDDDDLQTSRTYAKISDLIDRHNQVKTLQLLSFLIAWNQGNIYWYHAPKTDKLFGTTHIESFKTKMHCSQCLIISEEEGPCGQCGQPMEPTQVLDKIEESPKTRTIIDAFGGLHVKISMWARKQQDCGYLILSLDKPKELLKYTYPHIADKIEGSDNDSSFEKTARSPGSLSMQGTGDENRDLVTHKQVWLRPWTLEALPAYMDLEKAQLKKLFPDGLYVGYAGKEYAQARNEELDKHWTICPTSLASYIHSDALGTPLVPLQELRNVIVNLTTETVEQGMSSGFADPEVLDFDNYSKHEARPGLIYPARPRAGQTLQQSFHETGRATLSKEVGPFLQSIDRDAQFVVGSFPSLYGGPGEGKSRTLGEYTQSRQMALQRIGICWSLFCIGWAKMKEKAVRLFAENMIDDERFVTPDPNQKSNYINVWIRKAELEGKVGEVEAEGADSFPISTPQQQALFFKLLEMNNEMINAALFSPANRRMVADLTGFTDLKIPGESQRLKQSLEISDLIEGLEVSVDPLVDDHPLHIQVAKDFLVDALGLDLKKTNPMAYMAIEQHIQQHGMVLDEQTNMQFQGTPPGVPPKGSE